MGCFNMNCALSKLPITSQDEVIMIPMINMYQPENRNIALPDIITENTNILTPFPLCILGVYDDYGSIGNIQNQDICKILTKNMLSSNNNSDKNINNLDLILINPLNCNPNYKEIRIEINGIKQNILLEIKDEKSQKQENKTTIIYWNFVLKKIAEEFMNLKFNFYGLGNKSYNELLHNGIIDDLINGLDDINSKMTYDIKINELIIMSMHSDKFKDWNYFNQKLQGESFFRHNLQLHRELLNLSSIGDKNKITNLAKNILLMDCIQTSMLYLNNVWLPKSGIGQGWDKEMVNVIKFKNELCLNYINKKEKK